MSSPSTALPPDDLAMMRLALTLARQAAALGEVPVGAVLYQGDQLLAQAFNRRETDRDPTAHAEMLALRDAARTLGSWRLDGCTLVVTLEPCPMCAGALVNSRLTRLVYGAADPKMGSVDTLHQLCTDKAVQPSHRSDRRRDGRTNAGRCCVEFFRQRRGRNF